MSGAIIEKEFEYKGYTCCVILRYMGHRCGYVKVPKEHPYYKVDYMNIPVDCHGGLTYGSNSLYRHDTTEDDYWIGWDYAHYMDGNVPLDDMLEAFKDDRELLKTISDLYKFDIFMDMGWAYTLDDVVSECKEVVDQLIELGVTDGE